MKTRISEKGDVMAVVLAVLVVSLMAALGVIFYQNFVAKNDDASTQTNTDSTQNANPGVTTHVAFDSAIYELDHPKNWTSKTEKLEGSKTGGAVTKITNSDKAIEVIFQISEFDKDVTCDESAGLKVRYYNAHETLVKQLTSTPLRLVEAISEKKEGGYNYTVGLVEEGGDTNASIGDSRCTVARVGQAAFVRVGTGGLIEQPAILAKIDFPKLPQASEASIKSMDQVTATLETDDYKTAVKIIESARKK